MQARQSAYLLDTPHMPNAKTAIVLDTRREKKNGTYPVKVRVTFERKQKYFPTPIALPEKEFEKIMFGQRLSEHEKQIKRKISAYEAKAVEVVNTLQSFAWGSFEKQYLTNRATKGHVSAAFTEYTTELRKAGRVGTAASYECAQNSIEKFIPGAKFSDITPDSLRKYESLMLSSGKSATTIGIYLRSLRTLFNNAISDGTLSKEHYPFGKRKYEIPVGNNTKKALSLLDIAKIHNQASFSSTAQERSRDLFLLMYFTNGINAKDLCLLKYKNIEGSLLVFERAKTVRTKRKVEPIRAPLLPEALSIIEKWGTKPVQPDNYIFPVLSLGLSPDRERQLIQQFTRVINDHMKIVAKNIGISGEISTYWARHSYATVLKRSGASTEFISEALGHTNLITTKSYLASFEDDMKIEISKALTAFKK